MTISKGDRVRTKLGHGTVKEVVDRGKTVKYRVDVDNRGDSFVFYPYELEK